ncbi:hypothetical protein DFP73DRAFT_600097 [Morchella snyderi]|nr:hypothetical protein DFP73DRAFT_600097 [Morchella snyderi]
MRLLWDANDYFLVQRVLTTMIENQEIWLCVWRGPNEDTPSAMMRTEALIELVKIALPGHFKCDSGQEFIPEIYPGAVGSKIKRLYMAYSKRMNPESISQFLVSKDRKYTVGKEMPYWELLQKLDEGPPEENKAREVIDLTGVDDDGSGCDTPIKTEASDDSTPAKPSATLGPGAGVLLTSNKVTPSIETTSLVTDGTSPVGVIPRPVENEKRAALDSEYFGVAEEQKVQKAREHELAVLNAKIRLVEAETELAKAQKDHQNKQGSVLG